MRWLIHKLQMFCVYENHPRMWQRDGLTTSTESANQRATFDHLKVAEGKVGTCETGLRLSIWINKHNEKVPFPKIESLL